MQPKSEQDSKKLKGQEKKLEREEGTHGLSPTPRNASSTPFMAATAGGGAGAGAAAGEQELAGNGSSLHSAQLTEFSLVADKNWRATTTNFYPGILWGEKNGELT